MDSDNLIRMANQIGQFYESMPDRAEAMRDMVTHLKKFWDPRMRQAFLARVDSGDHGLSPMVLGAVQAHRDML